MRKATASHTGCVLVLLLCLALTAAQARAQSATGVVPFEVRLEAVDVSKPPFAGAPKLQSFVIAQSSSGNEWLLVGGRINGFHGFAPPEDPNFSYANANTKIWVVDLDSAPHVSSYDLAKLPAALMPVRDQLGSTNMQGYQDGNTLYLTGGYGTNYGGTGSLVTYSMLTAINVDNLIKAVSAGRESDVPAQIRFSNDPTGRLQVTGGEMLKLGDYFYLVMGQSFIGQYTPCVISSTPPSPACQQVYTDQVRRFRVTRDANGNPVIDNNSYWAFQDAANFHRRDLNITPTILVDGTEGIAAYSGVFVPPDPANPDANLPWRYPVYISGPAAPRAAAAAQVVRTHPADHSARVNAAKAAPTAAPTASPTPAPPRTDYTFEQRMNSYASANLLFYDPSAKTMYTTLFGGIGHHYYDYATKTITSAGGPPGLVPGPDGKPVFNDVVPFSNSIVTLVRDAQGRTAELVHDDPLPAFIGAETHFVALPSTRAMLYRNTDEIFDLSKLTRPTPLGYLYGGIKATPKKGFENWQKYGQWDTTVSDLIYRVVAGPARATRR